MLGVCELHEAREAGIGLKLLAKVPAKGSHLTHHLLRGWQVLSYDPFIVGPISRVNGLLDRI